MTRPLWYPHPLGVCSDPSGVTQDITAGPSSISVRLVTYVPRDLNRQNQACLRRIRLHVAYTNYIRANLNRQTRQRAICVTPLKISHMLFVSAAAVCRRYSL